ncbi:MAG TPA: DUF3829 domain-containing protein [Kofleriaceae bacterium]|nr:DUF3829 domain-containing protein [Kofleriaceae bacterium]
MNRSLGRTGIALSLVVIFTAAGCKKKVFKKDDEPAAAGDTKDVTSDRSLQVMNYYVDFFNEVLADAPSPLESYFEYAKDDGLSVADMTKWGNVICAGAGWMPIARDRAKEKLETAKRSSSGEFAKMPALGDAMFAAGVALGDQREVVCKYVKGGEFKSDGGARAKELHKTVVAAHETWNQAVGALGTELDRVQDAQSVAELKQHGQDTYGYWFRFMTIQANELLRVARRDPTKLDASFAALKDAITAAKTFAAAKGTGINETFAGYMKQVDRLSDATTKLEKNVRAAKTPTAKAQAVEKQFEDLISIYNTMISLHNTLIAAEGRGDLE